jgi:hypothetical protein
VFPAFAGARKIGSAAGLSWHERLIRLLICCILRAVLRLHGPVS